VNIEFHHTLVAHFQQQGLAHILISDIGAFHDLAYLERVLAKRAQDVLSIIQHDYSPASQVTQLSLLNDHLGHHELDFAVFDGSRRKRFTRHLSIISQFVSCILQRDALKPSNFR
jgi:predicted ATPase